MKSVFLLFAIIVFMLIPNLGMAEYRVFLLKISKRSTTPNTPQDYRLVESTLDPIQYPYYYSVAANEDVTYIDTWRCYGRTDNFKPHCPNPKGQIPATEVTPP